MKNLKQKIALAAATGAMFLNMAPAAFAGTTITITNSTNGRDSSNNGTVNLTRSVVVNQSNSSYINNDVDQDADTGDNEVKDNLGGSVDVETGKVNQTATVTTQAGMNSADVDGCGCDYNVEIMNDKNGRDSENTGSFVAADTKGLFQDNHAKVKNDVDQDADTGDNEIEDNIDGDVSLTTGKVDQTATVTTMAGVNAGVLGGGNGESSFELTNTTNGRDSVNTASAVIASNLTARQDNHAYVDSDVDQDADTGDNEIEDNLGGADLTTGKVTQDATLGTAVNANYLAADECCDVEATFLNEKNGRNTENNLIAVLSALIEMFQDNKQTVKNDADQDGDTGDNEIEDNNSDDMVTGDVDSDVEIHTQAGSNVIGGAMGWDFGDFELEGGNMGLNLFLMLLSLMS